MYKSNNITNWFKIQGKSPTVRKQFVRLPARTARRRDNGTKEQSDDCQTSKLPKTHEIVKINKNVHNYKSTTRVAF